MRTAEVTWGQTGNPHSVYIVCGNERLLGRGTELQGLFGENFRVKRIREVCKQYDLFYSKILSRKQIGQG